MKTLEEIAAGYLGRVKGYWADGQVTAHEMQDVYMDGYRDGLIDMQPRKIDPNDENTWPPDAPHLALLQYSQDLGEEWQECTARLSEGFYKNDSHGKAYVSHWMPRPQLSEGKK